MYVVIETAGKQYKVAKGDTFVVELPKGTEGATVTIDKVLIANDDKEILIGSPYLKGASVLCDVLGAERLPKVVAYKYKKRKSEKKKIGHRSDVLKLKVKEITLGK